MTYTTAAEQIPRPNIMIDISDCGGIISQESIPVPESKPVMQAVKSPDRA